MRLFKFLAICIVWVCVLATSAYGFDLKKQVVEYRLPNGMQWLFVQRRQAPVFSGFIVVRVGGVDETKGKTGLAHMFEHMAFKGSKTLGTKDFAKEKVILDEIEGVGARLTAERMKGNPDTGLIDELSKKLKELEKRADEYRLKNEIFEIMTKNGAADLNAFTSKDLTAYHCSMPINKLGLWVNIFADMLFNPVYREFYTERDVVAEERRTSYDNNPDGMLTEKILASSFEDGPYGIATIGLEKDIQGLTIADAKAFHQRYYVPSNMIGVIVGDIDIGKAKQVINRVFGKYPKVAPPKGPDGPGREIADVEVKFNYDAMPSIAIAYHKPTFPNPVEYTFDVLNGILCEGRSSRLQKDLVLGTKMVQGISCSTAQPGGRLANLYLLWIEPTKGYKTESVKKVVNEEIDRLKTEPVSAEELLRVQKNMASSFLFALDTNNGLAQALAMSQGVYRDWRLVVDYPVQIKDVTADDVMKLANKYLVKSNRVVVERERAGR